MFYRKNVGVPERWVRGVAGLLMLAWGVTQLGTGGAMPWLWIAGAVTAVGTGLVGFCPACALIGRKPVDGAG